MKFSLLKLQINNTSVPKRFMHCAESRYAVNLQKSQHNTQSFLCVSNTCFYQLKYFLIKILGTLIYWLMKKVSALFLRHTASNNIFHRILYNIIYYI